MRTGLNIKLLFCSVFSCSILLGTAIGEQASDDRINELTKNVDPFSRLAAWPAHLRPAQAINLCVERVNNLAEIEAERLKGVPILSVSEKQMAHLLSSISIIIETMKTVSAIRADFSPTLSSSVEERCLLIEAAVKHFQEQEQKDNSTPKLSDCLNLIRVLAQDAKFEHR